MTATELLDLIRRYGDTYRANGRGFSGAEIKRVDRQAGETFDEIEAAVAALKADRDHLLTLLENAANGVRLALQPRGQTELAAARVILEQTEKQIAKFKGAHQ